MFCKNCGTNLPEGTTFCSNCGTEVVLEQEAPLSAEEPVTAPVEETPAEQSYVEPSAQPEKPKKKFKFPKKLVFIGVPVVAVIVAILLNMYTLGGYLVKWFGSDSDYFTYVEKHNAKNAANTVSKLYGTLLGALELDGSAEGSVGITVGDKAFDAISSVIPEADFGDLDWLSEIDLSFASEVEGTKSQAQIGLSVGGKDIASIDYASDMDSGDVYIGVPEVSDKYIKIENESSDGTDMVYDIVDDLKETLPSESAINDLLENYIDVALECITDDYVTMKDGEITANGVKQSCTVIEVKVTDKLLLEMCAALLEAASDDEEIEEIVEQVQDALGEFYFGMGDVDVYDQLSDGMDQLLDEIEAQLDEIEEERTYCILTDYVNGTHEVIGRKVEVVNLQREYNEETDEYETVGEERIEVLFMGKAKDGDYGYEISFGMNSRKIKLVGTGSESFGGAITGEFDLVFVMGDGEEEEVEEKVLLNIETEDLDLGDVTEEMSGILRLRLGDDVWEAIGVGSVESNDVSDEYSASSGMSGIAAAIKLMDPCIEIEMDNSSGSVETSIRLLSGSDMLFELSTTVEDNGSGSVDMPDDDDAIDAEDMDEWLETVDFEGVIEALKDAGVDSELVDQLEDSLGNLEDMDSFSGFGSAVQKENAVAIPDYYGGYSQSYDEAVDMLEEYEDMYGDEY